MLGKKNILIYYLLALSMQHKLAVIVIDIFIRFPGILSLGKMHSLKTIPLYIGYKEIFFPIKKHHL